MGINRRHPGGTTNLTPQDVVNMRIDYAGGGYTYHTLGRKYGIGGAQAGKIVRGEAWQQVTAGEPVVTDNEAQLRLLNRSAPMPLATPQDHAESIARLLQVQGEVDAQQSRPSVVEELFPRRPLGELIKEMEERRARSGPPPEPVKVRYPAAEPPNSNSNPSAETAAVNAAQLLETLKDETQKIGD